MIKAQTVGSTEHAKGAVKETADRAIGETRMESVRKTHGLWARIQNGLGGLIEALRGK